MAALCSLVSMTLSNDAVAQNVVTHSTPTVSAGTVTVGTICPKCGKIHGTAQPGLLPPGSSAAVARVSYSAPVSGAEFVSNPVSSLSGRSSAKPIATSPGSGGSQNVLGMLNAQRSRQGLRSLRYDGALQAVAARRAQQMASMGIKSHPPGSFAPGRYEGVGWSSSFSPSGVYACYTSDPNMTAAGAAMVRGRDGVYFAVVYR